MTKTKEEYYIASAECYEVKYFDGKIATKDGQIVYFGISEGYPACQENENYAHKFKCIDEIKNRCANWNGMPWWYQLKPNTLKIYHITDEKEIIHTKEKVEI